MKTAVIVTGMCRSVSLPKDTWSILPFDSDWYMSTWDITKSTYSPKTYTSEYEINKIKDKFKHIEVHAYEPYDKEYLKTHKLPVYGNTYYLINKIKDRILNQNYDRIIVTRSDLYLHKITELTEDDFYVDDTNAKVIGMHEPVDFVNHDKQLADDQFICMDRNVFEKFSDFENFKILSKTTGDVHRYTYNFFKDNGIDLEPISKMRSVIIRPEAEEYARQNKDFTFGDLLRVYLDVYNKRDEMHGGPGKFFLNYNPIPTDSNKIMERVNKSIKEQGILRARNI